jgi:hypothetical protein
MRRVASNAIIFYDTLKKYLEQGWTIIFNPGPDNTIFNLRLVGGTGEKNTVVKKTVK